MPPQARSLNFFTLPPVKTLGALGEFTVNRWSGKTAIRPETQAQPRRIVAKGLKPGVRLNLADAATSTPSGDVPSVGWCLQKDF